MHTFVLSIPTQHAELLHVCTIKQMVGSYNHEAPCISLLQRRAPSNHIETHHRLCAHMYLNTTLAYGVPDSQALRRLLKSQIDS
jgi:hypothetical protein|mmetsp:Transcript_18434/g.29314  ORF Transcript_18434/g.29314 Transcript_18434/m.29314 type:complete len:84 (-) Transcript_18434:1220-1471(-)